MSAVNPDQPKVDTDETTTPPKPRIWTVMIYMAGDNNLSEECVYALTEAKDSLSDRTDELAVLAQFDPSGGRTATRRYLLRSKNKPLNQDAEITGWKARETDTGEPHNLLEFIRWGIAHYPARYYMVVLVGHGSGTDDDFLLQDDNPPNALNILELKYVFEQLEADERVINILGMDTCLMNMAEVCFELNRTSVEHLVGSEGFSPNTGWPYKEILSLLRHQVENYPHLATPPWLGNLIVTEYKKFYEPYINGGISIDQSLLEVKRIDEVKKRMFTLCGALLDELPYDPTIPFEHAKNNALVLAHWDAQSYNGEVFVDLHDFCDRLIVRWRAVDPHSNIIHLCGRVNEAIEQLVIKCCVAGAAFQFSYGLSIYFPWATLSAGYRNLAFPKETRWLDFLKRYHNRTRRPSRIFRADDPLSEEIPAPFRAAVPINKGRNGRTESMRNPPTNEVVGCVPRILKDNGEQPPPPDDSASTAKALQGTSESKKSAKNRGSREKK